MFPNYRKFRPTYNEAISDLVKHITFYVSSLFSTWYFKDSYMSILTIPILCLMTIRSFIIFHDCGHNSYFPNKKLNYLLGSILGIFVLTPYCWTYDHTNHHLTSGKIDNDINHRQNETVKFTMKEYKLFTKFQKFLFKITRNPLFFFVLNPSLQFIIIYRIQILFEKIINYPYKQSISLILFDTIINNVGIYILLCYVNQYNILYHLFSSLCISYSLGFILFHNQHTFNTPYVVTHKEWNKKQSGIDGSSFIQIPWYLKYFTLGIEYHHIHHMNSSVPGYKIRKLHEEIYNKSNQLDDINILTMNDCYHNLWYVLYDEENNLYITLDECNNIN